MHFGEKTPTRNHQAQWSSAMSKTMLSIVPRAMFRSAASTFGDVRRAESDARYEEISFQLFLQMLYLTANLEEGQAPADIYPYVKAWLEWIPHEVLKDEAIGYNRHAVSLH